MILHAVFKHRNGVYYPTVVILHIEILTMQIQ